MITTTKDDKMTLFEIHSQSGNKITLDQVKLFCALQFKVIIMNYLEGNSTHIPYLGELKIEHIEDKIIDGLNDAVLNVTIDPSNVLKREIGSIGDDPLSSLLIDDLINKNVLELDAHQQGVYQRQMIEEENEKKKTKAKKFDKKSK